MGTTDTAFLRQPIKPTQVILDVRVETQPFRETPRPFCRLNRSGHRTRSRNKHYSSLGTNTISTLQVGGDFRIED